MPGVFQYFGQFHAGLMHGSGGITFEAEQKTYTGEFAEGRLVSISQAFSADADRNHSVANFGGLGDTSPQNGFSREKGDDSGDQTCSMLSEAMPSASQIDSMFALAGRNKNGPSVSHILPGPDFYKSLREIDTSEDDASIETFQSIQPLSMKRPFLVSKPTVCGPGSGSAREDKDRSDYNNSIVKAGGGISGPTLSHVRAP
jgi:hypothetical protein